MDLKKKYYSDIISAIALIDDFVIEIKSFNDYQSDLKTKSAVERQLVIIGEAIKRVKDIDPNELIKHHSRIIGFRNIIVHS